MSILEIEDELFQINDVWFEGDCLHIRLKTNMVLVTPLGWYERLQGADDEELSNYRILPFGDAIHWPDLDEDLSVKGILTFAAGQARQLEVAE